MENKKMFETTSQLVIVAFHNQSGRGTAGNRLAAGIALGFIVLGRALVTVPSMVLEAIWNPSSIETNVARSKSVHGLASTRLSFPHLLYDKAHVSWFAR